MLYLTENQFLSACSLARLGTAVHPTLGMGEMRLEAQDETNNGLSGTVGDQTMESAITHSIKTKYRRVSVLLLPLAPIMCCPWLSKLCLNTQ